MAAVNKIAITKAQITKVEDGKFSVHLEWVLDEGAYDYKGDFELTVYNGETSGDSKTISSSDKKIRSADVDEVLFSNAESHSLVLKVGGKDGVCEKFPITLSAFKNTAICYDGNDAIVVWDTPHSSIIAGLIQVEFTGSDYKHTFTINEGSLKSMCLKLPPSELWNTQKSCTVQMTPCAGDNSFGPKNEELKFILSPFKITEVSMKAISNNKREITAKLDWSSGQPEQINETEAFVQLGFYEGERLLFLTVPIAYNDNAGKGTSIKHELENQHAHNATNYELAAFISDKDAHSYNRRKTADNTIPLASPKLTTDFSDGKLTLFWENSPSAFNCTGYELAFGTKILEDNVCGNSYKFKETADNFMDEKIKLTPKYSKKLGISAETIAFREGIYCTNGVLSYRKNSYKSKGFDFMLPESAFKEFSGAESKGDFRLEKTNDGYKVTVSSDSPKRDDYTNWITALFNNTLKPSGYYKIRDVISRLSAISEKDRLWYMAGIGDSKLPKCADILPGMTIRVETAHYMPQTSQTASNLAGYTPGNTSDYTVGLTEEYLDVSFSLGNIMGHFAYSGQPADGNLLYAAGGGLDFFNEKMKQPFWVLKYPSAFPSSENLSNLYDTSNPAIFAMDKWDGTTKEPDSDAQTHMVFRMRSTMTLMQTVFVNKTPRLVPVGITALGLMASLGCEKNAFRLYRNTGLGSTVEVFWFDAAGMLLMNGDHLDLKIEK